MSRHGPVLRTSAGGFPKGTRKIDALPGALEELFLIEHPELRLSMPGVAQKARAFARAYRGGSVWAYFPWRRLAVRIPDERTYFELRTARNRDLITEAEQAAYRKAVVGIVGLSVGSAVTHALTMTGGPKRLKLADPDTLEVTNLNRLKAALPDIGENKALIAARAAWELDPFLDIEVESAGLNRKSLAAFIDAPKLDVLIDEVDDVELKFLLRLECRRRRVAVVMATDNGEGAILDVERFDTEPRRPLFHGRVKLDPAKLGDLNRQAFAKVAEKIIDPKLLAPRQLSSLKRIGKTLAGVAQLGSAASIAGAIAAYAVRRIAAEEPLASGRYVISPEKTLRTR